MANVAKLHQNRICNTYQLYAQMASRTSPANGLKLGALTVIDWLRQRLGEACPEELKSFPAPSAYRDFPEEDLDSLRISRGFLIDIVSAPQLGAWSMQITEPDMGAFDANGEQYRKPVPGRTFESDIGFKVTSDGHLDCAFKTVVSDADETAAPAEVFRFSVVKTLAQMPAFGLKQIVELNGKKSVIGSKDQVRNFQELTKHPGNQLPLFVFCAQPDETQKTARPAAAKKENPRPAPFAVPGKVVFDKEKKFTVSAGLPAGRFPLPVRNTYEDLAKELGQFPAAEDGEKKRLLVSADFFAELTVGSALVFELEYSQLERFNETMETRLTPGDVFYIAPESFGGERKIIHFEEKTGEKEQRTVLSRLAFSFPRGKTFSFGEVSFLEATRESVFRSIEDAEEAQELTREEYLEKLAEVKKQAELGFREQDEEKERLKAQIVRQKEYAEQLEQEKEELRRKQKEELAKKDKELLEKDSEIEFLRRKCERPRDAADVPDWVEKYFGGRLLLLDRAVDLLQKNEARECNCGFLCDALEFLASEVYDMRYGSLSEEEARNQSSKKYGRTFDISPVNEVTYNDSKCFNDYHVRYGGDLVPLDFHLRSGNTNPYLVRIYYFYDDEKRLLVIGSLPGHLKTITFG